MYVVFKRPLVKRRLVCSVGRAPVCWAGGRGFAMTADFVTGLASIWSNKFTNSNEKKTCLLLCLLFIFIFQTLTWGNFWVFYFMSRLTLYECVLKCLYSAVVFNSKLSYMYYSPYRFWNVLLNKPLKAENDTKIHFSVVRCFSFIHLQFALYTWESG